MRPERGAGILDIGLVAGSPPRFETQEDEMKPRAWQIAATLVEVLNEFGCTPEEARDALDDAWTDFDSDYQNRAEADSIERSRFDNALGAKCDAKARENEARKLK